MVSLAADAGTERGGDNRNPYERTMVGIGSDRVRVGFLGIAHTHLDPLTHINYDDEFYNASAPQQGICTRGHPDRHPDVDTREPRA